MKSSFFFAIAIIGMLSASAQKYTYRDSLLWHQKKYVASHEVIKKSERKHFRFFPVNKQFRISASFERISDTSGFNMRTSGKNPKKYFRYGRLGFTLNGTAYQLTVYQSHQLMSNSKYKDYLFLPFTDLTSGEESYGGGRYLDFEIGDITGNTLILDFNKAYNPYCAYALGYNCPIPPAENDLPVAIRAGEKKFAKEH
jgi:uncharacterized protein